MHAVFIKILLTDMMNGVLSVFPIQVCRVFSLYISWFLLGQISLSFQIDLHFLMVCLTALETVQSGLCQSLYNVTRVCCVTSNLVCNGTQTFYVMPALCKGMRSVYVLSIIVHRNAVCLCTVNPCTMECGLSMYCQSLYNGMRSVYVLSILVQRNAVCLCTVNHCTMECGLSVHCQSLYSGTRSVYALSIIVQWSAVSQCTVNHCTMEHEQSI